MKNSSKLSSRSLKAVLLAGAVLLPASGAVADTIYMAPLKAGGTVVKREGVTITDIKKTDDGESLRFTTPSGDTSSKPLDSVIQIEADKEVSFNKAEDEFFKNDLSSAGIDYQHAIAQSTKDWVKHRSVVRLLLISNKTGDFPSAVSAFVELARTDPASASAHKPAIPDKSSGKLPAGITLVNQGLNGANLEMKKVVLPFLAELYNKNGDLGKASEVSNMLTKLFPNSGSHNSVVPGPGDTDNNQAQMDLKKAEADTALLIAAKDFASHDYAAAISVINTKSASFVDPTQQAKALFLIAESRNATATTPGELEEAAMAYMRVVAHFKGLTDGPAAEALFKTGVIEEKLKKPTEASLIYRQVVTEFHESKVAPDAQAALTRLTGGK